MKALVTGAGGFIGRILCRMLQQEGWQVAAVDTKSSQPVVVNHWTGSYDDPELYEHQKYDVVFHLGASSTLGPSVADPLGYFDNNVSRMNRMLQHIVRTGATKNIVFASSAATYGDPESDVCLTEYMAGCPINPYGWSKLMGEYVLEQACLAHGLNGYAMRFFNVAGAYEDLGQDLDQPHILTKMSVAQLRGEKFLINGNKYNTYDGTCVRDYIHVVDVCFALIRAANQIQVDPATSFTEYNVCSSKKTSNLELADRFQEKFGLFYEFNDVRPGDPGYLYGNNRAIMSELGWYPMHSLDDIIESHYDYIRGKMNGS